MLNGNSARRARRRRPPALREGTSVKREDILCDCDVLHENVVHAVREKMPDEKDRKSVV